MASMSLLEALREALSALRAHKLRSALTMLGMVIGVAAVIAMVAIGGGARERVLAQVKSLGANLFIVLPGNITQGGVRLGLGASSSLTEDDARAIETEIPSVQVTAPNSRTRTQVVAGGNNWFTEVVGVDLGWFEAREWNVASGRLFEPEEIQRGGQVVILGQTVARNLFGEGVDPIGETVRIRAVPFRVVGVMEAKGQSMIGQDQDDTNFVPLAAARQRLVGVNRANARSVGVIHVKVREGESMAQAEDDMRQLLRQRHRLQPGQEDDFQIRNLTEIANTAAGAATTLSLLLAAVAAISLAVGGIGIMNIMLVSVTERTREIGLRLAVGARRRDVMRQFLIEATTLAAIGGIVGILTGLGAAFAISARFGWPLLVEPQAVLGAVLFSGLVGVFFGWYPAKRASLLDPITALRTA
jgi:putative ABC transport system permease protein